VSLRQNPSLEENRDVLAARQYFALERKRLFADTGIQAGRNRSKRRVCFALSCAVMENSVVFATSNNEAVVTRDKKADWVSSQVSMAARGDAVVLRRRVVNWLDDEY